MVERGLLPTLNYRRKEVGRKYAGSKDRIDAAAVRSMGFLTSTPVLGSRSRYACNIPLLAKPN
jgi:hypothetical protein